MFASTPNVLSGPSGGLSQSQADGRYVLKTGDTMTGGLALSSAATTGLQIYNTADQTTNYERFEALWTSNFISLRTASGGTGLTRPVVITSGNSVGISIRGSAGNSLGSIQLNAISTNVAGSIGYNFSGLINTATSGTNIGLSLTPTYNQASGTAANTDLLINRTETAVGSGAQYSIQAQRGGH